MTFCCNLAIADTPSCPKHFILSLFCQCDTLICCLKFLGGALSYLFVSSITDVTSDVSFGVGDDNDDAEPVQNSTDEEKLIVMTHTCRNVSCNSWPFHQSFNLEKRSP